MSKEQRFWQYFIGEEERIFRFEDDQEAIFDRLTTELEKVHPDLTFEFGPVRDEARDFVITAGGIKAAFPAVENLYGAKPQLRRFRVIKFRPRRKAVSDLEFGGVAVRSRDVYFHLYPDDQDSTKVGIRLFLSGYSERQEREFGNIAYLMLDEAIGEYAVEMHVGFIELLGHDSPHFKGARPIADLSEEYDASIARRMH